MVVGRRPCGRAPMCRWRPRWRGAGSCRWASSGSAPPPPASARGSGGEGDGEVLVLGAGLVAGPAVELLSRCASRKVVVVSAVEGEAAALAATIGRPNIEARTMDCGGAADAASLVVEAIADASAALSLLPASMHGAVAAAGIAHGTPVVTASYISEELAAMGPAAEAAGVPVLGEMGLDPGMDHMSAMQLIDEAKAAGGRVVSFRSVCGGLPAPDAANNPLRYKFSWSPRGVLSAALNSARWLENGEIVEVGGADLLSASAPTNAVPTLNLEAIPNRDSTPYQEAYGLQDAHTVYRGTLRYRGACERVAALQKLGMLDLSAQPTPAAWDALLPPAAASAFYATCSAEEAEAVRWLEVATAGVSDEDGAPPHACKLDALAVLLSRVPELQFHAGERDMCVMQHEVVVEYCAESAAAAGLTPAGATGSAVTDVRTSHLILFGDSEPESDTAMAKTVGLTAAAGVELVLSGPGSGGCKWGLPGGVHMPTVAAVYNPVLEMLEKEGLTFTEQSTLTCH